MGGSEAPALVASQRCSAVGMRFIFLLHPLRKRGRLRLTCVCACAAGRQLRRPQLLKGYRTLSISNCSMKLNMKKPSAFSEVSLLRILNVLPLIELFFGAATCRYHTGVNERLPQHLWTDMGTN